MKKFTSIIIFVLFLIEVPSAYAGPSVSNFPSGKGVFTIYGSGFDAVAGIKLTTTYDASIMNNPRITVGSLMSGAMLVPNTKTPGTVIFALLQPAGVSGSGPLAIITFDMTGSSQGKIDVALNEIVGVAGGKVAADTASQESSQAANQTAGGNIAPGWLGGVTIPSEGPSPTGKERENTPSSAPDIEQMQTSPVPATQNYEPRSVNEPALSKSASVQKTVPVKSALELFREFRGEKSPKNLIALLKNAMEGTTQEPRVALTDGATKVKVFIDLFSSGKKAPNFALKGVKLVSLKNTGDNAWVVEVLPDKGAYTAAITVLQDNAIKEIPLMVAPPLPADGGIGKGGKLTEADFNLFLKERGVGKAPRFDLNGDGKKDYIDDYIFTANFILKSDPMVKNAVKAQK
jgi:hypothetical protein